MKFSYLNNLGGPMIFQAAILNCDDLWIGELSGAAAMLRHGSHRAKLPRVR